MRNNKYSRLQVIVTLAAWLFCIAGALPVLADEIVVKQDRSGKIVVSNNYTNHNYNTKKSKRVRFQKSSGVRSVPQYYLTRIRKLARKYGVKESLIRAVVRAESGFNPFAVSKKGAVGLMQLMPDTARQYGVFNRYNADQNLEAGVKHLKYLYKKYKKDLPLTLAAYNAGEEAVKKYKGVPPYRETRTYIKRVMKFMGMRYSTNYKPVNRQIIYKIITKDGRVIITDTKPSKVDGQISIID
ncbi:MAG: lytic transglycosylase domain-containing protein [bacterium]|nr:lytic transglycosylase domain-containing protein [bacterium]